MVEADGKVPNIEAEETLNVKATKSGPRLADVEAVEMLDVEDVEMLDIEAAQTIEQRKAANVDHRNVMNNSPQNTHADLVNSAAPKSIAIVPVMTFDHNSVAGAHQVGVGSLNSVDEDGISITLSDGELDDDGFPTYRVRFLQLFLYTMIVMANQLFWVTFAPITSIASEYYDVSASLINLIALTFSILVLPGTIVFSFITTKSGMRVALLVSFSR